MRFLIIIYILLFLSQFIPSTFQVQAREERRGEPTNKEEISKEDHDSVPSVLRMLTDSVRPILEQAKRDKDVSLYFSSAVTLSQAYLRNDDYDSARIYLDRCYSIWEKYGHEIKLPSRKPLYVMYNSLAILSANANMDYEKATEYILAGLKIAREVPDDPDYAVMGQNLVSIFFIRQNPAGLKYAQEIYQDGITNNNIFLEYIGSYGSAMMYSLCQQYDSAYNYLNRASKILGNEKIFSLNNIYGDIFAGMGVVDSADFYYKRAFEQMRTASVTDITYLHLSYGSFQRKQGHFFQAESLLKKGLDFAIKSGNKIFVYRFYKELSDIYTDMGNYKKALDCYKEYVAQSEMVYSIKRERAINGLTLKYESEKHKNEMNRQQMILLKNKHHLFNMIIIFIFTGIVSFVLFVMYRNKSKMYTKIVKQYRNAIDAENRLKEEMLKLKNKEQTLIQEGLSVAPSAPNDAVESSDAKDEEFFFQLETLMKEQLLFKDPLLTREKLASILGTNRTYLSRIVNVKAGMSYNQYLNSYRIKEAIRILSDTTSDVPLKALSAEIGFSSISTFYKLFQEEVGMTPAKYRKKICELSQNP